MRTIETRTPAVAPPARPDPRRPAPKEPSTLIAKLITSPKPCLPQSRDEELFVTMQHECPQ